MSGQGIRIDSRAGGSFECYLAMPSGSDKVPAIVLASAVHGVDRDIRDIADAFASQGYIAAAPDLFWRSIPGPLARDDKRAGERSQPRLEKIKAGEADMADTLAEVRKLAQHNGRAAVIGFCYGGPYAILGPKRLGYDAGISCHGTQMLDFVHELEGVRRRCASSGATRISPRRHRCAKPTRPRPRGWPISISMFFPACCTATCSRATRKPSRPRRGSSRWRAPSRFSTG